MSAQPEAVNEASFGPVSLRDFDVSLENFNGPFDLLLRLIARKEMDLTEVALASVTDEFLHYLRQYPDLSSATDFLVVAATLIQMKAAALLPNKLGEDDTTDEDLEARDLLFSRLLQYRAFQEVGGYLQERWERYAGAFPRSVPLEPHFAAMLPELRWTASAHDMANIAAAILFEPVRPDEASHVATPAVSFQEQLALVASALQGAGTMTFSDIVGSDPELPVVVTRFLALLELYRGGKILFHQDEPLGLLEVTWSG